MVRNAFCSLAINFLSLFFSVSGFALNHAAEKLSQNFYIMGNDHVVVREWKKGMHDFKVAHFLDPSLVAAAQKIGQLQKESQQSAMQFYKEGLRDYQTLRYGEARFQWQRAFQLLIVPEDPLKNKIERALQLLSAEKTATVEGPVNVAEPSDPIRKAMEETRAFLEQGDPRQAVLVLKEALQKNPMEKRVQNVSDRLQHSLSKNETSSGLSEKIQEQFELSQKLWGEKKYKEALALFKEEDLKPPFYHQLEADFKKNEETLLEKLKPMLENWERELRKENPDLETVGLKLREARKKYPPSPKADQLLQEVYAGLQKKSEPVLMEAKTVQELEGCVAAKPIFEKAEQIAVFVEVPVWQEAHRYLMQGIKNPDEPKK